MKNIFYTFSILFVFFLPTFISAATIGRPMSNSGLVGYWSFEDGKGSSQVVDRSGNSNHGTLTNMNANTAWTNGATTTGQALSFDGANDYVNIADFFYSDTLSVCLWFKASSVTADLKSMIIKRNTPGVTQASVNEWGLSYSTAGFHFFSSLDSVTTVVNLNSATIPSTGVWYYLCAVQRGNGDIASIYIDGIEEATYTQTGVMANTTNFIQIGARSANLDTRYLSGSIDEVRIYNRALSSSEVARLYKIQAPRITGGVSNSGLIGYWSFDEGRGTRTEDVSVNNNSGTLTGGASWSQGKMGKGVTLNGSTGYVTMGSPAVLFPTGALTVSYWIKINGIGSDSTYGYVSSWELTGTPERWAIGGNPTCGASYRNTSDTAITLRESSITLDQGVWYMCTVVFNPPSTTIDVYTNGVLTNGTFTNNGAGWNAETADIEIGRLNTTFGYGNNTYDEVRMYNRSLSAAEIYNLYKGSRETVTSKTATNRITNGLVGYWTFDGKDLYANSKAMDVSGNGNTGTLTNGPGVAVGAIGQALSFDGSDDYLVTSILSSFVSNNTGSISMWVKPTGSSPVATNAWESQVLIHDAFDAVGIFRGNIGSLDRIWMFNWDGSADTVGITYSADEWTHIVWVHSGGVLYGYKNGQLAGSTASGNTTVLNQPVTLGGFGGAGLYYKGALDDIRMYSSALSADEIKALYTMGK